MISELEAQQFISQQSNISLSHHAVRRMFCANTPREQPAGNHSHSTRSQALEEPCPASSVYRPLSEGPTFLTVSLWVRPSGVTEIWCLSLAWRGWLLCSHRGWWQGVHSTHWNSASPASAQRTSESGCRNRAGMAAGKARAMGRKQLLCSQENCYS